MAQLTGTAFAVDDNGKTIPILNLDAAGTPQVNLLGTAFSNTPPPPGQTNAIISVNSVDTGSDNPTGDAGVFNGVVFTAGQYDPLTANARREVMDIVVAGAVGTYPLAFGRVSSSKTPTTPARDFGPAGKWTHSYQWSIDANSAGANGIPSSYNVNSPGGARITLALDPSVPADPYFRGGPGLGIRHRLNATFDGSGNSTVNVILPDGGKITFAGTRGAKVNNSYPFTYVLQSITDPFGQITTITTTANSITIKEPALRTLIINFRTITNPSEGKIGDKIIDNVTASDGRVVTYSYSTFDGYTCLTGVSYFGISTWNATYTYQVSNIDPGNNPPLLSTAVDPMFSGPMWAIRYVYQDPTISPFQNPNGTLYSTGQIKSECSLTTGEAVSTLSFETGGIFETRGSDNKRRQFNYTNGLLLSWTDWLGVTATRTHDSMGFVNSQTDRNQHTTAWVNNFVGKATQLTFPTTTPSSNGVSFQYGFATCPDVNNRDVNNPYYLYSKTDAAGNITTFFRDAHKRVTQINYPDGGIEQFSYNPFGQILTCTIKTGGLIQFSYDGRGLLQTIRNPDTASGNPTFRYTYDAFDRVFSITNVFGTGTSDTQYTINGTYNLRGQLLVCTYPVDPNDSTRHTEIFMYNPDGSLASFTNRLGKTTHFTYDLYKRLRTVTGPGHGNTQNPTQISYSNKAHSNNQLPTLLDDYTQTANFPMFVIGPDGRVTAFSHDADFRGISTSEGYTTADVQTYTIIRDFEGNVTVGPRDKSIFQYDARNRLVKVTDPFVKITQYFYDSANRLASTIQPNGQGITWDRYDSMNRLLQATVKQTPDPDAISKVVYNSGGQVHSYQPPSGVESTIFYTYDSFGRLTQTQLPGPVFNRWHYNSAGQLDTFTNRNGATLSVEYDNFSRITSVAWDDLSEKKTFAYDANGQVSQLRTIDPNTLTVLTQVDRTYYDDGLLATETNTIGTQAAQTIGYTYDQAGRIATTTLPDTYVFQYAYNNRGKLQTISVNGNVVVTYDYDNNDNVTGRTLDNSASDTYAYDLLNRCTNASHNFPKTFGNFNFPHIGSNYTYDAIGNVAQIVHTSRQPNPSPNPIPPPFRNGITDVFNYDINGQLTAAAFGYPALTPTPPPNTFYDANGNRISDLSGAYETNALDQYTAVEGLPNTYDSNGNLLEGGVGGEEGAGVAGQYTYDNENKLLYAKVDQGGGEGSANFLYDALNRLIKKDDGTTQTFYVYDGWDLVKEYTL